MSIRLGFHGAAGTVTGSKYLLRREASNVMVDCGLFQGLKRLRELNWAAPNFDVTRIGTVLITHAHLDHIGYLPRLERLGFRGRILATPATIDLSGVVLRDAGHLQEEDAEYANRKGFSKHKPALPLFTEKDADAVLKRFEPVPNDTWIDVEPGVRARWSDTGHLLGAAMIEVAVQEGGQERVLLFSGDVGRYSFPLHVDPKPRPRSDVLVIESTYGDRPHPDASLEDQILEPLTKMFAQGGIAMIPAFALGRAQLLIFLIARLMRAGRLPEAPIHLDSPMAIDATEIYLRHLNPARLDADVAADGRKSLLPKFVTLHRTATESRALNGLPGPRIIIAGSGMMTGGRIIHHVRERISDPENLVMLPGFQAEGTRGRALMEGAKILRMHGREIPVRAKVISISGLSGHAGADELLRWYRSGPGAPTRTFVTHGEPGPAAALAETLRDNGASDAKVPTHGDEFDV